MNHSNYFGQIISGVENLITSVEANGTIIISEEVDANITNASLAITHSALTELGDIINSSKLDVNIAASAITQAVSGSVSISGTPAVTVSSGSINATCSGTVAISGTPAVTVSSGSINATCTGAVDISNTPAVTVSSGSINATCTGSVSVSNTPAVTVNSGAITETNSSSINTSITNQEKQKNRQNVNGMEISRVGAYNLIYKSVYPSGFSSLPARFESFDSNASYLSSNGGLMITPVSAPTGWRSSTRFSLINGNNNFLIVFPCLMVNSNTNTNFDCGIQYEHISRFIFIRNDYTTTGAISLQYTLNELSGLNIAMASWNVDAFAGAGPSAIDLTTSSASKEPLSWFISLSSSTNYCYIGLVQEGKLWVGHQFSIRKAGAVGNLNTHRGAALGFRPFIRNNITASGEAFYSGGDEIYCLFENYLNIRQSAYSYYGTLALAAVGGLGYPFSIRLNNATYGLSYIRLKSLYAKTTGTLDEGDFRIEVYHTVDTEYVEVGGTASTSQMISRINKIATSFSGGSLIATYLPKSDNCIEVDLNWIDHKHFGYNESSANPSYIYFIAVNMSASVAKTLFFAINWTE